MKPQKLILMLFLWLINPLYATDEFREVNKFIQQIGKAGKLDPLRYTEEQLFSKKRNRPKNIPIVVTFDAGRIEDKALGQADIKGTIPCLVPYGLFPKPDLGNILSRGKIIAEWVIKNGLISEEDNRKYTAHTLYTAYTAAMAIAFPPLPLTDDRMLALSYLASVGFAFDDIVDSTPSLQPRDVKGMLDIFEDILEGRRTNLEQLPDLNFPLYIPLVKSFLDFQELAIKSIANYESRNFHFLERAKEYLESIITKRNLEDKSSELSSEMYLSFRKSNVALLPGVEYSALMNEITLSQDIRENPKFKRLIEAGCDILTLTNDIMSLSKEIKAGETGNLVIIKVLQNRLTLQDSFSQVLNQLNDEILDFISLSHNLREEYADDKELPRYISTIEHLADGLLYFYFNASFRYGQINREFVKAPKPLTSESLKAFSLLHEAKNKIPSHIAFICDGNRRWAMEKGLDVSEGYEAGLNKVFLQIVKETFDLGVHTATLWVFAPANWKRNVEEVNLLMKLGENFIDKIIHFCQQEEAKLIHLGRKDRIPSSFAEVISRAEKTTCDFSKHVFNMALDYDGRDEIIRAIERLSNKSESLVELKCKLREGKFEDFLDTAHQPYPNPDLVIRTSGEQRLSGFMSWQTKDSEFYFLNKHFPDLNKDDLVEAISEYSKRVRRHGK